MTANTIPINELQEIKAEIAALRSDMNRYTTDTPRLRTASLIEDFQNTCAEAIAGSYRDTGCDAVGIRAGDCAMWENCRPVFAALFEEVFTRVRSGKHSPETIEEITSKIASLSEQAPSERCESCFAEMEKQLENQFGLLAAIGMGQPDTDTDTIVRSLPTEKAALLFSNALGSPVRIQVLKALYKDAKSFTDLSKLTGLRGGNLLFHLDKLQKSALIVQHGERGEYRISYRGHEVLNAVAELVQKLD